MNEYGPPRDHFDGEDSEPTGTQQPSIEQNLRSKATWIRVFFMIAVFILWVVSRIVIGVVMVFQLFNVLLTGSKNQALLDIGQSLAAYSYQIIMYLTFNSDVRPFPFDAGWPAPETSGTDSADSASSADETST